MHAYRDCTDFVHEGTQKFPNNTLLAYNNRRLSERMGSLLQSLPLQKGDDEGVEKGYHIARAYPWMQAKLFRRSSILRASLNEELRKASNGRCVLRETKFRRDMSEDRNASFTRSDTLSIFAKDNIRANETIFGARDVTGAVWPSADRCDNCSKALGQFKIAAGCC